MSNTFEVPQRTSDAACLQEFWSRMFGSFLEHARQRAGRSIEEAAARAGMSAEQWTGVEAGAYLPLTRRQFHLVADAVGMEWETLTGVVLLCRSAWGMS